MRTLYFIRSPFFFIISIGSSSHVQNCERQIICKYKNMNMVVHKINKSTHDCRHTTHEQAKKSAQVPIKQGVIINNVLAYRKVLSAEPQVLEFYPDIIIIMDKLMKPRQSVCSKLLPARKPNISAFVCVHAQRNVSSIEQYRQKFLFVLGWFIL